VVNLTSHEEHSELILSLLFLTSASCGVTDNCCHRQSDLANFSFLEADCRTRNSYTLDNDNPQRHTAKPGFTLQKTDTKALQQTASIVTFEGE
jgi:hypothetical protein